MLYSACSMVCRTSATLSAAIASTRSAQWSRPQPERRCSNRPRVLYPKAARRARRALCAAILRAAPVRLALTERWFDRRRPRSSSHPSWFVEYHRVRAEPHMRSHSADSHTCQAHTLARARAHTGQATLRAHTGELAAADVQPHVGPVEWLLRQVLSIIPLRGGPLGNRHNTH